MVALTGRLHGWPVPETEIDRRVQEATGEPPTR
jgi:hypothetical protein